MPQPNRQMDQTTPPQVEQTEREAFEAALASITRRASDLHEFARLMWQAGRASMQAQAPEVAALQREVEELRADALRYRWLRDRARVTPLGYIELHSNRVPNIACDYLTCARFDAAIDNALASKAEVPNG